MKLGVGATVDRARQLSELIPLAYEELRRVARQRMAEVGLAALLMLIVMVALVVSTVLLRRARTAEGVATSKERAAQYSAATLRIQQGNAYSSLGRFAQARDQLEIALDQLEGLGGPAWVADLGIHMPSTPASRPCG
jgi:hypothetical protein